MDLPAPILLENVDPHDRLFPPSWRDAAIRATFDDQLGGVKCGGCGRVFRRRSELRQLQADHIIAWSVGGPTTWENMQLLCASCNLRKLDR